MAPKAVPFGWLFCFAALGLADLALTFRLIEGGAGVVGEGNPVAAAWLDSFGWAGLILYKADLVLSVGLLCAYVSVRRRRLAVAALRFGCAATACVVLYSCWMLAGPAPAADAGSPAVELEQSLLARWPHAPAGDAEPAAPPEEALAGAGNDVAGLRYARPPPAVAPAPRRAGSVCACGRPAPCHFGSAFSSATNRTHRHGRGAAGCPACGSGPQYPEVVRPRPTRCCMQQDEITVLIRRLPGNEDLPLPQYQTAQAVAMDLHAAVAERAVLPPGKILLVPCGFAVAVPAGYEAQVRPRSGLAARHGVTVVNSPGTIDPDYRGEVKVALVNLGDAPFAVERGLRVAQLLVFPVPRVRWVPVAELPETARGEGGFGHTGR